MSGVNIYTEVEPNLFECITADGNYDYLPEHKTGRPPEEQTHVVLLAAYDAETARADRAVEDYQRACDTIAKMHAAAVGYVGGPKRGVVEDIQDLKAERDRAEAGCAAYAKALGDALSLARIPDHSQDVEWYAEFDRLVALEKQPHPGSRFLELAQIVEECDVCSKKLNSQRG